MEVDWKEQKETRVLVSPEIAEQWLERNKDNRRLSKERVADLVETIKRGGWEYNGQSISFDSTGRLLDGQHRLTAIAQAGVDCEMLVCFGLKRRVAYTQDTGMRRHLSEQSRREGSVPQPRLVASWAQTWGRVSGACMHRKWSAANLRDWYKRHKKAIDWLIAEKPSGSIFRSPICVVLLFAFEAAPDKTRAFVDSYKRGTGLTSTDPVYLLREQALRKRTGGHIYQQTDAYRAAAAIAAFFDDEKRTRLVVSEVAFCNLLGISRDEAA